MKIDAKVEGLEELQAAIKGFKQAVRSRVLRKAINAGSGPMLKAVKARAPRQSGQLRKSIARKIKTYSPSGTVVAVIGPRSGFGKLVVVDKKTKKTQYRDPLYYSHLVEFGTKTAQARPFLRPAYDETKASTRAIIAAKAMEEIEKEAAKLAAKKK